MLLGVDDAGRAEAWVATRPGCVVFGETVAAALAQVPAAAGRFDTQLSRWGLSDYGQAWLPWPQPGKSAGAAVGPEGQTGVHVLERVAVGESLQQGNTAAFFHWDAQPASSPEVVATLRLLSRTRTELLDMVRDIKPVHWAARPGGGRRNVEEILRHVAQVEWWYTSRIVDFPIPERGWPPDVVSFLSWTRRRVASRLQALTPEERSRITVPDPMSGEQWSARKVLRRLVYHELYHIEQLRRWRRQ